MIRSLIMRMHLFQALRTKTGALETRTELQRTKAFFAFQFGQFAAHTALTGRWKISTKKLQQFQDWFSDIPMEVIRPHLHPSMTSVTSSTCDGKMRGYILKSLPNRGI